MFRSPAPLSARKPSRFPGPCRLLPLLLLIGITVLLSIALPRPIPAQTDIPSPVSSAAEIGYPPFSLVDSQGRADGFSIELMRAALAAIGRSVTFRTGPWAEVREWLERGEVQALPLMGRTPEREAVFDFTFPYMTLHGAIVVRKETEGIRHLDDLSGRRVGVMRGDNAEEFLRREERGIAIVTTPTFEDALSGLSRGDFDAVIVQRLVALRLLAANGFRELMIVDQPVEGFRQDFSFAVNKGDSATLALLNEGLALTMADGTFRRLHAKWFAALELPSSRRILVGGDHNYPPFEFLDHDGHPAGYNVELTRAIALATGMDIEIRLGPWPVVREALALGEIDALQGMFYSPERNKTYDFAPPHVVNHGVGVVRASDGPPPATLEELAQLRIVVQESDIMHDFLLENGLEDRVSVVDSQETALRELAGGLHDCALVSRVTALYLIRQNGWKNLTIGSEPFLSPEYGYAVPKNQKALMAKFSEGLLLLENSGEYRRIHDKWMGVQEDEGPGLGAMVRSSALIAAPLLGLALLFFLWSWTLRRKVSQRTSDLRINEAKLKSILDAAPIGIGLVGDRVILDANDRLTEITGYAREELVGQSSRLLYPTQADFDYVGTEKYRQLRETGTGTVETRFKRRDGTVIDVLMSSSPLDPDDLSAGVTFTVMDITDRKRSEKALRESEERFSKAFQSNPGPMVI
jgi:PAS domain S-box-containing protein